MHSLIIAKIQGRGVIILDVSKQLFSNITRSDIISVVLLICGVVLLLTLHYRLSIFFITSLLLFQVLQQIIQAGVRELTFGLQKGTVSAKMIEKKKDLKQHLERSVSDGAQVPEELSQRVQDGIDDASMFGYKVACGHAEIGGVSIQVKDGQKIVNLTEF
jgi:ABC-type multidrug transport system fused ATPase/permease subunit